MFGDEQREQRAGDKERQASKMMMAAADSPKQTNDELPHKSATAGKLAVIQRRHGKVTFLRAPYPRRHEAVSP